MQKGYADNFTFNYSFEEDTVVTITETLLGEETAEANVSTVAAWISSDGNTHFTGAYVLPSNCTLVERGVLIASDLGLLEQADGTNGISIPNGVILGKINGTKPIFTASKRPENGKTWYGRAYMVYTDINGANHVMLEALA